MQELLVYEIRITKSGDAELIPVGQDTPELAPRRLDATRDDERGGAKIDEPDVATLIDAPSVPEFGGQARLPSMRHLCVAGRGHRRIVQ
jgi:hypothetical protein